MWQPISRNFSHEHRCDDPDRTRRGHARWTRALTARRGSPVIAMDGFPGSKTATTGELPDVVTVIDRDTAHSDPA